MTYTVAVLEVDLAFGGREEGGWYYEVGSPTHAYNSQFKPKRFRSRAAAQGFARQLRRELLRINVQRPEISSVASEGRLAAYVFNSRVTGFPAFKPHYE